MQKAHNTTPFRGAFNTLAQNGTGNGQKGGTIITGKGTELRSDKVLKGRAKRKMISQKLALTFLGIAEEKGNTVILNSLWNSYHCQSKIYSFEGRIYGRYCKNRFCTLCNSIRKAEIINKYSAVLKAWDKPYFVTLTIKACKQNQLRKMFKGLVRGFRQINAKYRKRNQRGCGIRLIGIKSMECNFNPKANTYNPHLHLIVENKRIADLLIDEWLAKWSPKFTVRAAQDKRPVNDIERDLVEIIKYGSKIFTEPDINKKSVGGNDKEIYAAALYNIFVAMKGLRIFERFGFNLPSQKRKAVGSRFVTDFDEWIFIPQYFDWQNVDNELVLSSYSPKAKLVELLDNNINTELE
jgi:hypothetical protein